MTWYSSFKSLFIEDKRCSFSDRLYEKCLELWNSEKNLASAIFSDYLVVLHLVTFLAFILYIITKEFQIKMYKRKQAQLYETIRNMEAHSKKAPVAYLVKKYGRKRSQNGNKPEETGEGFSLLGDIALANSVCGVFPIGKIHLGLLGSINPEQHFYKNSSLNTNLHEHENFDEFSSETQEELIVITPPITVQEDVVLLNNTLKPTKKAIFDEKIPPKPKIDGKDHETSIKKECSKSKHANEKNKSSGNLKHKKKRLRITRRLVNKRSKTFLESKKIFGSIGSPIISQVPEIKISKFESQDELPVIKEPKLIETQKTLSEALDESTDQTSTSLLRRPSPPRLLRSRTLTLKRSILSLPDVNATLQTSYASGDQNSSATKSNNKDLATGITMDPKLETKMSFKTAFNIEHKKFDFKFNKNDDIQINRENELKEEKICKLDSGETFKTCDEGNLGKTKVEFENEKLALWNALSSKALDDLMELKKRVGTSKSRKRCPKPKLNHSARLRLLKNQSLPTTPLEKTGLDQSVCSTPTTPQSRVASTIDEFKNKVINP